MAKQIQFRRGTTAENDAFTGVEGELTYDTQTKKGRFHDGTTAGGNETLADSDLGVSVQEYDADTTKNDVANTFTAGQRGDTTALVSGAAVAIELNDSNNFSLTLDENATLSAPTTLTAAQVDQSGFISITQDGVGSRTLAYNAVYKFAGGVAPVLSTGIGAVDVLAYYVKSTTEILIGATLDIS